MKINGGKVLCLIHNPTSQKFALLAEDNCYGCDSIMGDRDRLSNHIANILNFHGKLSLKDFSLQIVELQNDQ